MYNTVGQLTFEEQNFKDLIDFLRTLKIFILKVIRSSNPTTYFLLILNILYTKISSKSKFLQS